MQMQAAIDMRMLLIWSGVALVFGGILFTAFKGSLVGRFRTRSHTDSAAGFSPRRSWPGLVMLTAGVICFLAAAAL